MFQVVDDAPLVVVLIVIVASAEGEPLAVDHRYTLIGLHLRPEGRRIRSLHDDPVAIQVDDTLVAVPHSELLWGVVQGRCYEDGDDSRIGVARIAGRALDGEATPLLVVIVTMGLVFFRDSILFLRM